MCHGCRTRVRPSILQPTPAVWSWRDSMPPPPPLLLLREVRSNRSGKRWSHRPCQSGRGRAPLPPRTHAHTHTHTLPPSPPPTHGCCARLGWAAAAVSAECQASISNFVLLLQSLSEAVPGRIKTRSNKLDSRGTLLTPAVRLQLGLEPEPQCLPPEPRACCTHQQRTFCAPDSHVLD